MHKYIRQFFFAGFFLILLISGCSQRYWYRLKLDGSDIKRYTIKVDVVNHTPKIISQEFENILKNGALKELKKFGYYETPKDSPDFYFVMQLAVDSFNMLLYKEQAKIAIYSDSLVKAPDGYRLRRTVKAILMQCDLVKRKPLARKWSAYEDIYFFNDYVRDVGRSEGVIRYLVRSSCEKDKLKEF